MNVIQFEKHGGREVLALAERPIPNPGLGEACVKVEAASVNYLDIFVRNGLPGISLPLPHIPGSDASGVVIALGEGVKSVQVGDPVVLNPGTSCGACRHCQAGEPSLCQQYRMFGEHLPGCYAQYMVVPAQNLHPMPRHLSYAEAASLPLTLMTAWRMLERGRIASGETMLLLAAGSGVGVMVLQIARMMGLRVIATASSLEKRALAQELGADVVLDSGEARLDKTVRKLTSGEGADVVVDYVGKSTWATSLRCLRNGGRLLTCGATSGFDPQEDLRHIFYRQLSIIGSTMGSSADLKAGLRAVEKGHIRPVLHQVLPLEAAAEAHALLEERRAFGKIVLEPFHGE